MQESSFFEESQSIFFPKQLQRSSSTPELSRSLLKSDRNNLVSYRAAISQLLNFIKNNEVLKLDEQQRKTYFKQRKRLAQKVLIIGTQLYAIYDKLTDQPIEKQQLAHELYFCELLTGTANSKWKQYFDEANNSSHFSLRKIISNTTSGTNWYRLFALRLKRVFTALMPLIKSMLYQDFINTLNTLNPALRYIAWMFYVPRVLSNLTDLLQHTIAGPWLTEEEQFISFSERFKRHWGRLWFELLNDTVWCFVGLMCCFVLSPAGGLLLTVGLYFFDMVMAFANASINLSHHKKLQQDLKRKLHRLEQLVEKLKQNQQFEGTDLLSSELTSLRDYQSHVDDWILYEQQKLILSSQITTALATAMTVGALPTMFSLGVALSTLCPLVSATAVVLICLNQFIQQRQIEENCPDTNILNLQHLEEQLALENYDDEDELEASTNSRQVSSDFQLDSPISSARGKFFSPPSPTRMVKPYPRNLSCPEDLWGLTNEESMSPTPQNNWSTPL